MLQNPPSAKSVGDRRERAFLVDNHLMYLCLLALFHSCMIADLFSPIVEELQQNLSGKLCFRSIRYGLLKSIFSGG